MATRTLNLIIDTDSRTLLAAMGSRSKAASLQVVQGDKLAVEVHLVTLSDSFSNPTPESAVPTGATILVGIGTPGSDPIALTSLTTTLPSDLGRAGTLSLNNAAVETFLGGASSKTGVLEVEMTETDGTVTTLCQIPCTVINDLIADGGTPPAELPLVVLELADHESRITTLEGTAPTADQKDAMDGANSPGVPNPFATMADVAPAASETVAGRVEIATQGETAAGTDDVRAVTPLKLKTRLDARTATATTTGLVKQLVGPGIAPDDTSARGDDIRLGEGGGAEFTSSASNSGTTPVTAFSLTCVGFNLNDASAFTTSDRWLMKCGSLWSNGALAIRLHGNASQLGIVEGVAGSANYIISDLTVPSKTRWIWLLHNESTRQVSIYFDNAASAAASATRTYTGALSTVANVFGVGGNPSHYTGKARGFVALNYLPTQAQRLAIMRGEYAASDIGGTVTATQGTTAWTDASFTANGGTITVNSGGLLDAQAAATAPADYTALRLNLYPTAGSVPSLTVGRVIRVTLSGTTTGTIPSAIFGVIGITAVTASIPAFSGTTTVDYVVTSTPTGSSNLSVGFGAWNSWTCTGLTVTGVQVLGAQVLVSPTDWHLTRAADRSGNANDLIYGTGVVAIAPKPFARVITTTVAGATVTAGTVASVGAVTGSTFRDVKALAALRQWDAVSGTWGQARPTNAGGLVAAATANGTLLLEAASHTSNATVAANTAVKVVHTIS